MHTHSSAGEVAGEDITGRREHPSGHPWTPRPLREATTATAPARPGGAGSSPPLHASARTEARVAAPGRLAAWPAGWAFGQGRGAGGSVPVCVAHLSRSLRPPVPAGQSGRRTRSIARGRSTDLLQCHSRVARRAGNMPPVSLGRSPDSGSPCVPVSPSLAAPCRDA